MSSLFLTEPGLCISPWYSDEDPSNFLFVMLRRVWAVRGQKKWVSFQGIRMEHFRSKNSVLVWCAIITELKVAHDIQGIWVTKCNLPVMAWNIIFAFVKDRNTMVDISINKCTNNRLRSFLFNFRNLVQMDSLVYCTLSRMHLGDDKLALLYTSLKDSPIRNLVLLDNGITGAPSNILGELILNSSNLMELDLRNNLLRNAGVKCLLDKIIVMQRNIFLNLSHNRFDNQGTISVCNFYLSCECTPNIIAKSELVSFEYIVLMENHKWANELMVRNFNNLLLFRLLVGFSEKENNNYSWTNVRNNPNFWLPVLASYSHKPSMIYCLLRKYPFLYRKASQLGRGFRLKKRKHQL